MRCIVHRIERRAVKQSLFHDELLAHAIRIGEIHVLGLQRHAAAPIRSEIAARIEVAGLVRNADRIGSVLIVVELRGTAHQRSLYRRIAVGGRQHQFFIERHRPDLSGHGLFEQRGLARVDQHGTLARIAVHIHICRLEGDFVTGGRLFDRRRSTEQLALDGDAFDFHVLEFFHPLLVGFGHEHRHTHTYVGLLGRHGILAGCPVVDVDPLLNRLQLLIGVVLVDTPGENHRRYYRRRHKQKFFHHIQF